MIGRNATNIGELQTEIAAAERSIAGNEGRITAVEGEFPTTEPDDAGEWYLAGSLRSQGQIRYWDKSRQIPISGTVGHVLTKTGSNDTDYAFRAAPSGGGGTDTTCLLYTSPSPRDS